MSFNDISGFGSVDSLVASKTFPSGIILTQYADDTDPFDLPEIQIGDAAKGVNGDFVGWKKAPVVPLTLAFVPGSANDVDMSILLQANTPLNGIKLNNDIITLTHHYPDGSIIILRNGIITHGMPGKSIASAGRFKSKTYKFMFETYTFV